MDLVTWLFLDLNSYFASVEQELRPELRGKPVGVVPVMADTTCCIAASYEAKAFGVKTGTLVGEAKKLCPKIQLVEARHDVYVHYHHKIVDVVESCVPIASVMSIDEMACQLTGSQREIEKATRLAHSVKTAIRENVGLTLQCSIGLAPNRFLAKVASNMQKPDGMVVIKQSELPQVLYTLPLRDFPGIGRQMEKRLVKYGIRTSEQLLKLSKDQMRKVWGGVPGERFWYLVHGDDIENIETRRRSIGHSHVLPPDMRTRERAYLVAQKLVHKAAVRLRRMDYWTTRFSVFVKFVDDAPWDSHVRLVECQDTLTLLEALQMLWSDLPSGKPLAVGVTLSDLVSDTFHTCSLFEETKRTHLAKAMDRINLKYGVNVVHFGNLDLVKSAAPTRIAFTSIPDLEDL